MEKLNIPRLVLLFFLPLLCVTSVWAVDPDRRITQYAHTAWRVQDGIEVGTTVTQTLDGYLWFGTSNGLQRFDGVTFVSYDLPPITPPLRSFNYLLGASDGSLWIGTRDGLALSLPMTCAMASSFCLLVAGCPCVMRQQHMC
jgi:ligand-binding sensor domain-containing protein